MKKHFHIALTFVLGVFALVSCNYLEPDNKTAANQTADEFFSSDPSSLRIYAYSLMKDVLTSVELLEDGTDLYMPSNKKAATDYDQYSFNVEDNKVKAFYSNCYSVINMANCCIYYDAAMEYNAEMRWLRNFCYYLLMQQFGGVPYSVEYINSSNREYPRMDLMTEYRNVLDDLEAIRKDSHLAQTTSDGIVSAWAVDALIAKVALAAGWDAERAGQSGTNYFQKADTAAARVMAVRGNVLPIATFEEKWSPNNENNDEVIFAVQYDRGSWKGETKTGGHGLQNTFGSYLGDCTSTGLKYSNSYRCINPKASYLWEEQDARWEGTFMTEILNATKDPVTSVIGWGTDGYYAYYNVAKEERDLMPVCLKFFPGTAASNSVSSYKAANASRLQKGDCANTPHLIHMTYPSVSVDGTSEDYVTFVNNGSTSGMFSAPSVKKWDDPQTENIALNTTNCYRDIVALHLSDIYLVAAEAKLKLKDEKGALELINAVRARSGASTIESFASYAPAWHSLTLYQSYVIEPIDLILDERARELFAEGQRWMDLHRTGKLKDYNNVFNAYCPANAAKHYRPIPQAEINANQAMSADDQNPEWK